MARKNLLANLIDSSTKPSEDVTPTRSTMWNRPEPRLKHTGALGAVTRSIDALAARAAAAGEIEKKLTEGEVVVELDPELIDGSFIPDRLRSDDQAFGDLLEAIRQRGQDSPILVRPHPTSPGRYQVAFGHRRLKVAKILGKRVRAVVKVLDDRSHVVAQGQENSARADLSFIERAYFAHGLEVAGFDRETIMAALTVDKTTLSKMLSLFVRIPEDILSTIQHAFSVGRDRWNSLSAGLSNQVIRERALTAIARTDYLAAEPDDRFARLEKVVKAAARQEGEGVPKTPLADRAWQDPSGRLRAKIHAKGIKYSLVLEAQEAVSFGAYLEANLERLFTEFEQQQALKRAGD